MSLTIVFTLDGLISYNRTIFSYKLGFTTLSEINTGSTFFSVKLRDVSNNLQTYFPVCKFVVCLPWSFLKDEKVIKKKMFISF